MISVEAVTKKYGGVTAVDHVTCTAEPGRVTGFLRPNGAGKSTTLRVVVGRTPPTAGSAHVLGVRFIDLPNPGLDVGVLLDASAQHAGRTGREILSLPQRLMGLPSGRVDETLDLVSQDRPARHRRNPRPHQPPRSAWLRPDWSAALARRRPHAAGRQHPEHRRRSSGTQPRVVN